MFILMFSLLIIIKCLYLYKNFCWYFILNLLDAIMNNFSVANFFVASHVLCSFD